MNLSISSVCVYCGSANQVADTFKQTAQHVGTVLAQNSMRVIYGGGHVGLMGIVADAALTAGAQVIGIIPEHIRAQEVQHTGLTKLHVVPDMHIRKRMMVDHADAFVILPGGLGTLDEAFEVITWKKLKLHNKPIIVFNQEGYWDDFLALVDHAIREGFAGLTDRKLFDVVTSVPAMLEILQHYSVPPTTVMTGRM